MNKNQRDSKWIDFVPNNILFTDEQMKTTFFTNYHTDNKINLRVCIVDKRASGGNAASFGGANENFEDPIDGFDILSDGENENGNDRNHNNNNGNARDRSGRFSSHSSTASSASRRSSTPSDSE